MAEASTDASTESTVAQLRQQWKNVLLKYSMTIDAKGDAWVQHQPGAWVNATLPRSISVDAQLRHFMESAYASSSSSTQTPASSAGPTLAPMLQEINQYNKGAILNLGILYNFWLTRGDDAMVLQSIDGAPVTEAERERLRNFFGEQADMKTRIDMRAPDVVVIGHPAATTSDTSTEIHVDAAASAAAAAAAAADAAPHLPLTENTQPMYTHESTAPAWSPAFSLKPWTTRCSRCAKEVPGAVFRIEQPELRRTLLVCATCKVDGDTHCTLESRASEPNSEPLFKWLPFMTEHGLPTFYWAINVDASDTANYGCIALLILSPVQMRLVMFRNVYRNANHLLHAMQRYTWLMQQVQHKEKRAIITFGEWEAMRHGWNPYLSMPSEEAVQHVLMLGDAGADAALSHVAKWSACPWAWVPEHAWSVRRVVTCYDVREPDDLVISTTRYNINRERGMLFKNVSSSNLTLVQMLSQELRRRSVMDQRLDVRALNEPDPEETTAVRDSTESAIAQRRAQKRAQRQQRAAASASAAASAATSSVSSPPDDEDDRHGAEEVKSELLANSSASHSLQGDIDSAERGAHRVIRFQDRVLTDDERHRGVTHAERTHLMEQALTRATQYATAHPDATYIEVGERICFNNADLTRYSTSFAHIFLMICEIATLTAAGAALDEAEARKRDGLMRRLEFVRIFERRAIHIEQKEAQEVQEVHDFFELESSQPGANVDACRKERDQALQAIRDQGVVDREALGVDTAREHGFMDLYDQVQTLLEGAARAMGGVKP